jgi:amino-acid N-acetyltransferase
VTIRQADLRDARQICALIKSNPLELIVRPLGDIVRNIDRFTVVIANGRLIGCASYAIMPEAGNFSKATVELTSVAIRKTWRGHGLGRRLVLAMLKRVLRIRPVQILVLTYTPEFFRKIGFVRIAKKDIMHKIYSGCVNCTKHSNPFTCPEIAMAYEPGGAGVEAAAGETE